jgi:hypothetical protein
MPAHTSIRSASSIVWTSIGIAAGSFEEIGWTGAATPELLY